VNRFCSNRSVVGEHFSSKLHSSRISQLLTLSCSLPLPPLFLPILPLPVRPLPLPKGWRSDSITDTQVSIRTHTAAAALASRQPVGAGSRGLGTSYDYKATLVHGALSRTSFQMAELKKAPSHRNPKKLLKKTKFRTYSTSPIIVQHTLYTRKCTRTRVSVLFRIDISHGRPEYWSDIIGMCSDPVPR
jgi:hypothetical protein